MTTTYPCIQVNQPIGTFFITAMPASELVYRLRISPRTVSSPDAEEVQRETSDSRIREIANYVRDRDATFPTAIIISCDSDYTTIDDGNISFASAAAEQPDFLGELIDGQHRIKGLRLAQEEGVDISRFELPVVVMLDLLPAQKAYVFSIINSKQTPVSKSLIYDLFGLSKVRSPYLTCHEIARAMNTEPGGPFEGGLKMLGKRKSPTEMLTQGSFVRSLLRLITSKPDDDAIALKSGDLIKESDRPFNAFFRNNRDELILQSMNNYFSAIRQVFPREWDHRSYVDEQGKPLPGDTPVFRRTVGYEALMRALALVWDEIRGASSIDSPVFLKVAERFRRNTEGKPLDTEHFGSSGAEAGRLARLLAYGVENKA